MLENKSKAAVALAAVLGMATTAPVNAELLIHTGHSGTSLSQGLIGVGSHVTNLGSPFYLKKGVVGFGKDIPLSLAMDSLKPQKWSVLYNSDVPSDQPVSWSRSGNWNDVLADISKNNNLVSVIDWNAHTIRLMEMVPSVGESRKAAVKSMLVADDSPYINKVGSSVTKSTKSSSVTISETISKAGSSRYKPSGINGGLTGKKNHPSVTKKMAKSMDLVNGLVYVQGDDGCTNRKIDIEKMVMDTNWLDTTAQKSGGARFGSTKSHLAKKNSIGDPEFMEHKKEMELLARNKERMVKLRGDYKKAYLLSGNGSFQDFVNGGGIVKHASETTKYVYIYKKGTLFNTIKRWSERNGFVVKNDVYDDHHIDYENIADVSIKGTYKEVVTTLLSKYRNAKTPIMFTFYEAGGSKVLHIFESKYRSSYV